MWLAVAVLACSGTTPADSADSGDEPFEPVDLGPPPTVEAELLSWLEAGDYTGWLREAAAHDSAGPHFGDVRVYVNPALTASLDDSSAFVVDAAAVKELYGDGDSVLGWSVMVRTDADSWYWYETFEGSVYAASEDAAICTDCHVAEVADFLSDWPLE